MLRRFERREEVSESFARRALADLAAMPTTRYPHAVLLDRALDLRANATMYDAMYLALAEAVKGELLTVAGSRIRSTVRRPQRSASRNWR